MDYADVTIYNSIISRVQSKAAWLTTEGHSVPKTFQWYNEQYEQQEKNLPFERIALFIEMSDTEWKMRDVKRKQGTVRIALHIVQDLYVQGREGAPQHNEFKDKLNYPYAINQLLDGWNDTCFKNMKLVGTRRDHSISNLMVHIMQYETDVVLNTSANPVD